MHRKRLLYSRGYGLMYMRARLYNQQLLTFTSQNATITPSITLSGDGPCRWEVTEANGAKYYYSANSFSHTRSVAGNMVVRLLNTAVVAQYVTQINFNGDGIISSFWSLNTQAFRNLTYLNLGVNQFTGNLSGWTPLSGLTELYLYTNQFTGDLSGWTLQSGLTQLYLSSNQFTGGPPIPASSALQDYRIQSQGATNMTQPRVDAIISSAYVNRAGFSYATPTFNVGGTNAAPSGTYADEDPPVTGNGMKYELVNDPEGEGFNKQVWTTA